MCSIFQQDSDFRTAISANLKDLSSVMHSVLSTDNAPVSLNPILKVAASVRKLLRSDTLSRKEEEAQAKIEQRVQQIEANDLQLQPGGQSSSEGSSTALQVSSSISTPQEEVVREKMSEWEGYAAFSQRIMKEAQDFLKSDALKNNDCNLGVTSVPRLASILELVGWEFSFTHTQDLMKIIDSKSLKEQEELEKLNDDVAKQEEAEWKAKLIGRQQELMDRSVQYSKQKKQHNKSLKKFPIFCCACAQRETNNAEHEEPTLNLKTTWPVKNTNHALCKRCKESADAQMQLLDCQHTNADEESRCKGCTKQLMYVMRKYASTLLTQIFKHTSFLNLSISIN